MAAFRARLKCSVLIFAVACALPCRAAVEFSRDIQPILSENCYHCHGPDANHRKADLRLDDEKAAKSGKIILPGKADESELIQRIFSHDPDEVMPTPKSNRKLTDTQKQLLKQWIAEGAKWGKHWAFEPVIRPKVPAGPNIPSTRLCAKSWPQPVWSQIRLHRVKRSFGGFRSI